MSACLQGVISGVGETAYNQNICFVDCCAVQGKRPWCTSVYIPAPNERCISQIQLIEVSMVQHIVLRYCFWLDAGQACLENWSISKTAARPL